MYLIDSNIFIYFLKQNDGIVEFLEDLDEDRFAVSIVSRFEILAGAEKERYSLKEIEQYLDDCDNIVLDSRVVTEALNIRRKLKKKLKFTDLVIAATARLHKKILITADKDFKNVPGLKVVVYK
jgi:predicted nucleic acid-binding protein